MSTTIKDIARELGVSITSVSNALSDKGRVSDELKERVKEKAVELNYQRNIVASRLATKKSNTIGVCFFDSNFVEGTEIHVAFKSIRIYLDEIKRRNYDLLLFAMHEDNPETHEDILNLCMNRMVEGVIVLWAHPKQWSIQSLLKSKLPAMVVESPIIGMHTSHILFDNHQGIKLALEHLYELGHRNVGYIKGSEGSFVTMDRLGAFEHFAKKYKCWNPDYIYQGDYSLVSGVKIAHDIHRSKHRPSAIIVSGDLMAVGLIRGLEDCQIAIPDDMSIIGYDGFEIGKYLTKKLTTIVQDLNLISIKTIDKLFQMIHGQKEITPETLPVSLFKGETTAAFKSIY